MKTNDLRWEIFRAIHIFCLPLFLCNFPLVFLLPFSGSRHTNVQIASRALDIAVTVVDWLAYFERFQHMHIWERTEKLICLKIPKRTTIAFIVRCFCSVFLSIQWEVIAPVYVCFHRQHATHDQSAKSWTSTNLLHRENREWAWFIVVFKSSCTSDCL